VGWCIVDSVESKAFGIGFCSWWGTLRALWPRSFETPTDHSPSINHPRYIHPSDTHHPSSPVYSTSVTLSTRHNTSRPPSTIHHPPSTIDHQSSPHHHHHHRYRPRPPSSSSPSPSLRSHPHHTIHHHTIRYPIHGPLLHNCNLPIVQYPPHPYHTTPYPHLISKSWSWSWSWSRLWVVSSHRLALGANRGYR